MNELALVEMEDLYDNPTPRVPVALCLDCSGSMYGAPIAELNEGVKTFYHAIDEDEIARFSAEICGRTPRFPRPLRIGQYPHGRSGENRSRQPR